MQSENTKPHFVRAYFWGFLATALLCLFSGERKFSDLGVTSFGDAKLRKQWWAYKSGHPNEGVGVDFLSQPKLLAELFPNYSSEIAHDRGLWRDYFSRTFDFDTRVPSLGEGKEQVVSLSWMGCLDLIKRYGADTLILGNSETFRMLIPSRLGSKERVLECMRNGMSSDAVVETARFIAREKIKLRKVVMGYSLMWTRGTGDPTTPDRVGESSEWAARALSETPAQKVWSWMQGLEPRRYLSAPAWKAIFPWHFLDNPTPPAPALANAPTQGILGHYVTGFLLSPDDRKNLNALVEKARPLFQPPSQPPSVCRDSTLHRQRTNELVDALEAISEKVYLYRTPINGLGITQTHPCVISLVDGLLKERISHRVSVNSAGWEDYGLDWDDYVVPFQEGGKLLLDTVHTNENGAKKVTEVIGRWISEGRDDLL